MKGNLYLLLVLGVITISSCVKDIGVQIQSHIEVPKFSGILQDAATDIVLTQGPVFSVDFEGSDIILGDLDFIVANGTLIITQQGHYGYSGKSTIYITVPDLFLIESRGSGDIYGANRFYFNGRPDIKLLSNGDIDLFVDAAEMNTTLRGTGTVRLRGDVDYHAIDHDGFGFLDAFGLQTAQTRISQYSSGKSEIQVRNNLMVRLRGSGDIFFIGNPFIDYSVTGFGRLIDAN